jgi:hypothetical protein
MKSTGEATSAETVAASDYTDELADLTEEGGYCFRQKFNTDKTGFLCEKMSARTYLAKEKNTAPGFKPAKDRLTKGTWGF